MCAMHTDVIGGTVVRVGQRAASPKHTEKRKRRRRPFHLFQPIGARQTQRTPGKGRHPIQLCIGDASQSPSPVGHSFQDFPRPLPEPENFLRQLFFGDGKIGSPICEDGHVRLPGKRKKNYGEPFLFGTGTPYDYAIEKGKRIMLRLSGDAPMDREVKEVHKRIRQLLR